MQSSPSSLYQQGPDKQRVVVLGKQKSRITQLILFVLSRYQRKFDYSTPSEEKKTDSSVQIFEPAGLDVNVLEYHHHILIISQLQAEEKTIVATLAKATPKSGTIIYDDSDTLAKEIGKPERVDVFSNPYSAPKHEMDKGKAVLISSTSERFATSFSSREDLLCVSAAKELLKKIGISSSQFYKAISAFQ